MARGGARVGAGRKPKDRSAALVSGSRQRMRIVPPTATNEANEPQAEVNRPKGLSDDDKAVWDELAPFALEQRTLTPAMAMAFADLCGYIVLERRLRIAPLAVGGADHRGLMQRIEVQRARFRLVPDGKPVIVSEGPKDEFAEFDGPQLVKSGA